MPIALFIFLGLLGLSAYYFVGAVSILWTTLPLVLCLPFCALNDIIGWFMNRKRKARSKARLEAWEKEVRESVEEGKTRDGYVDYDENGVRYQ